MHTYTTKAGTTARLKDSSVDLEGTPQQEAILDAAGPLYALTPQDLVVTSANDGTHSVGSLHYEDLALDLRVWNVPDHERLARKLQQSLGTAYDVIAEWRIHDGDRTPSHIHVEYDPS